MNIIMQNSLEKYKNELIRFRRYLHAHPELSFQEYETSQYIFTEMSKLTYAAVTRPTPTSVLVRFITDRTGPKIGLRADIDALAVTEERDDLDFKSMNPGRMHACGHDAHTAILMAACLYFDEHFSELEGEIWAIFQHAEEVLPGGARELIATGLFNDIDFFYGQHLWTPLPIGVIGLKEGAVSANTDGYKVLIKGKGGHASAPHAAIDSVIIGSMIVQKLQTIVTRMRPPLDPGVISNTVFQAGNIEAYNAIPDTVTLAGSVRSTTKEVRALFQQQIEKMVRSTCDEYDATCEFEYILGYSMTINDPEKTTYVRSLAGTMPEVTVLTDAVMLGLGGEDFSEFGTIAPSVYAVIGAGNVEKDFAYPHHHPKFGLDEDGFLLGVAMFINVACNYRAYFNHGA